MIRAEVRPWLFGSAIFNVKCGGLPPLFKGELARLILKKLFTFKQESVMDEKIEKHVDWPHSPPHWLEQGGNYIVTGATYRKVHFFKDSQMLRMLNNLLLEYSMKYGWTLHTWAVFPNHYHFVGACNIYRINIKSYFDSALIFISMEL